MTGAIAARSLLLFAFAALLPACRAPAPCAGDGDCASLQCVNGACLVVDRPDLTSPDAQPADAQIDATADAALDAGFDATPDAANARDAATDLAVDQRADMPCDPPELELDLIDQIAPIARGESYSFEVRHEPGDTPVTVDVAYGAVARDGRVFEWAPRGGSPGDLPWPWWTGPVELTVTVGHPGCTATERFAVNVVGDVLIFDEVSGVIWTLGSDGQLLGQWVQVPGNGVTALALGRADRTLLAAVRQVDAEGRYVIHRLDADGMISATLEADDFRTGLRALAAPAKSIVVLRDGRIVASGGGEDALPYWGLDDRIERLAPVGGVVSVLGALDGRVVYGLRDEAELYTVFDDARINRLNNRGPVPNALFALHSRAELLYVHGPDWDRMIRYTNEQFADLLPAPQGTDIRAWTPFSAGYLTYDRINRRLRRYDTRLRSAIDPRFDLDIPAITVGGLLWLNR